MNELLLSTSTTNEYNYPNDSSMMVNIDSDLIQQQAKANINSATSSTAVSTYTENSQQLQYASYPAYTFQPLSVGFSANVSAYTQALPRLDYFDDPSDTGNVEISAAPTVTANYNRQPTSPASVSSSSSSPSTPPPPHTTHLSFAPNSSNSGSHDPVRTLATPANELLTAPTYPVTSSTVTCAPAASFPRTAATADFSTLSTVPNRQHQQQQTCTESTLLRESSPPMAYAASSVNRGTFNTSINTGNTVGTDMTVVAAAAVTTAQFTNSTTARVKEMISRANSIPMEFFHTEFLEYSKETYERKLESKRNKRKRPACTHQKQDQPLQRQDSEHDSFNYSSRKMDEDMEQTAKRKRSNTTAALGVSDGDSKKDTDLDEDDYFFLLENAEGDEAQHRSNLQGSHDSSNVSHAEIRRQIHIQSEQKRRAQIKDGFDELRKHLPGCNNKKMSKAALLTRTVQQLQHLKGMQNELLSEVERLLQENEALKKFQHGILQRQAMDKPYTF